MKKTHRLFLLISSVIFVLSIVMFISNIFTSYCEIKTAFPNDKNRVMNEFGFGLFFAVLIMFPVFGAELFFIRSIYKILKCKLKRNIKIRYIVSSVFAVFAVAFYYIASSGLISFVEDGGYDCTATVLLFTEWPIFILSFVLGI